MKKLLTILMCVLLIACLVACGADNTTQKIGSTASEEIKIPSITNPIINNNITDSSDMMEIDSPVGKLYYPEKWKDDVVFQVNGNQLVALYDDIPIFTLYFGGEKGFLYGTVNHDGVDTELRYEMHDLDSEREDYETMSAMQDDINVIFYYLTEGK